AHSPRDRRALIGVLPGEPCLDSASRPDVYYGGYDFGLDRDLLHFVRTVAEKSRSCAGSGRLLPCSSFSPFQPPPTPRSIPDTSRASFVTRSKARFQARR